MTPETTPQQVMDVAAVERLGMLLRVHDSRPAQKRALTWVVILGIPGILLVATTLHFVLAGVLWAIGLGALLALTFVGAATQVLLHDVLPGWGRVVYLFENGFVHMRGQVVEAYAWEAIHAIVMAGLQRGPRSRVAWRFTVSRHDGHEVSFGNELPEVRELGEVVSTEVAEHLLPKYISAMDTGSPVELGPFVVSREGVAKDGDTARWAVVRGAGISNGLVFVNRADRRMFMTTTAGQMPNAVAFTALVEHGVRTLGVRRRWRLPHLE